MSRAQEMKALVKAAPEPGLELLSQPVPSIEEDEVLIRVKKTGICGTDIHIWKWDAWAARTVPTPLITGHEFAGEIVELGAAVENLRIGQRVSGEGHLIGHSSRATRAGRFHLDPETRGVGVNEPGAFADYLKLPAFNVIPLPDAVDDEIGAILDPLGNAVHTALSFDLVGEDVLIAGAGPIGIMAGAVARQVGARHIVITDVNADRLALAAEVADVTPVNVLETDLKDAMAGLGMTEGFDVGLEMSGAKPAFDQMVDTLIMGGKIAFLGLPAEGFETDWSKIVLKSLTIKGVYGREMFETWHKMLGLLKSGLDVRRVITHRYSADAYQDGFAAMLSGKSGKVVLDWAA